MHITFRPDQGELAVNQAQNEILVEFANQTGDTYTLALGHETANILSRCLIERIWLGEHAPELAAKMQEPELF
ncbi:MAG: hypothetical protein WC340_17325 [Kiritimatiellia bacterium]